MSRPDQTAPSPDVQYLPTIFRRIQRGDIRMPAFQRGQVWEKRQVLELLNSIYNGFPIGSILLWRTANKELRLETSASSYFPQVAESYPTNYILDGLQRLSSLYAVFHFDRETMPDRFEILFDPIAKEFLSASEATDLSIPLNVIFKPNEFVKFHSALQAAKDGSNLVDTAVSLHTVFQEYQLPIVTIEGRTTADVVQIFERINSTGTRLGAVDFIRAVTWSEEFDLNQELEILRDAARDLGFDIPPETLVKILAIALNLDPKSDSMLKMRSLSPEVLKEGVGSANGMLGKAIAFLKTHMKACSYLLIPYEAQLLATVGFCAENGTPPAIQSREFVKWYWQSSLNEEMQGRSESQVSQLVLEMRRFRAGIRKRLRRTSAISLATRVLRERAFRIDSAISSAVAGMLAAKNCRSLITGDFLHIGGDDAISLRANFTGFLDASQVAATLSRSVPGGKVVANIVAIGAGDKAGIRSTPASTVIRQLRRNRPSDWEDILASQFISDKCVQALLKGRPSDFLEARAQSMIDFGIALTK